MPCIVVIYACTDRGIAYDWLKGFVFTVLGRLHCPVSHYPVSRGDSSGARRRYLTYRPRTPCRANTKWPYFSRTQQSTSPTFIHKVPNFEYSSSARIIRHLPDGPLNMEKTTVAVIGAGELTDP